MSERLPYEMQLQQQWIDLPLPDENMAWADMKRRLEEDDDRPVIAWWRKGCVVWGTLLLVLLAIGWWWFRPEQWFISESTQQEVPAEQRSGDKDSTGQKKGIYKTNETDKTNTDNKDNTGQKEGDVTPIKTNELTQQQKGNTPLPGKVTTGSDIAIPGRSSRNMPLNGKRITSGNSTVPGKSTITTGKGGKAGPITAKTAASSSITTGRGGKPGRNQQPVRNNVQQEPPVNDNAAQPPVTAIDHTAVSPADSTRNSEVPDSVIAKTDSVKKTDTAVNKLPVVPTPKTDSSKKKKVFYSAGIAIHQQIPLAGQKFTPYSASGRKFSLADYIPSVYFRVNKENKWFIQGEFRYGAPQYTKEFLYKDQTKSDTFNQVPYDVNTKATLKKTFYHQLPVTFNYYVLTNWSIGAGLAWNKFSSAISDQEVIARIPNTSVDSIISGPGIVKIKKDSVFSSSYFQAVFETHYKWKRFSFGARYMFGLQPYIKFTLPGGTKQEERNSSLQVFLRYELWRSRKK